jgi:hypothetical protein
MMSEAKATKTVSEKAPYVAPEIIDYGDGREATKGVPGPAGVVDGSPYVS